MTGTSPLVTTSDSKGNIAVKSECMIPKSKGKECKLGSKDTKGADSTNPLACSSSPTGDNTRNNSDLGYLPDSPRNKTLHRISHSSQPRSKKLLS